MQELPRRSSSQARTTESGSLVTRAIGLEETTGLVRARRSTLFTQTIIWVTGLVCVAFLLGSLAQAWSNSLLRQRVQEAQQQTQQLQAYHDNLTRQASHYANPFVIESEARQELGYVRPGEHLVVVVGSSQQEQQTTSRPTRPTTPLNYWQQWWSVFFGK